VLGFVTALTPLISVEPVHAAISYFWPYLMGSEHGVQPAPYQSDKALAETGDPVLNLALMVYRRD
jgi:hypothetical protein